MMSLRDVLVLPRQLGAGGLHAGFQIGVRKRAGTLKAHAWVEYAGKPVGELPDIEDHFVPIALLRSA